MKLIAVSGACRGVGKTYVAMQLCEILGDAVYAKIGHGAKAPSKPKNFFTSVDEFLNFLKELSPQQYQYCIVESNNHSICKLSDVRIFIDAPKGATDIRSDAVELRELADIVITPYTKVPIEKIPTDVSENFSAEKIAMLEKLFRGQQQFLVQCHPLNNYKGLNHDNNS